MTGLSPTTVFEDGSPFYDPANTLPSYNPAQALIDAYNKDNPGQFELTIKAAITNRPRAEAYQALFSQYKNIKINISIIANNQIIPDLNSGDFQSTLITLAPTDPEPLLYDRLRCGAPRAYSRICNPDLDAALD